VSTTNVDAPLRPQFICVGAQKSGTAWLYDQARSHPRIWMPPVKEIGYYGRGFGQLKKIAEKRLRRSGRHADQRAVEFLRRASQIGERRETTLAEYVGLFEPAGTLITGISSPLYEMLREDMISQLASELPSCRFLYLLREPIGRMWSQVNMEVRNGKAPMAALTQIEEFQQLIRLSRYETRSFPSQVISRWRDVVGNERFRVFVMDDLSGDAVAYRRSVFAHIGVDGDECTIAADFNKKAKHPKAPMPDSYRTFLLDYFGQEYEHLAQLVDIERLSWPHNQRLPAGSQSGEP
jgi:hypothetical protein